MIVCGALDIIFSEKNEAHTVVYVKLHLKADCRKKLRLIKEFYRYDPTYSILRLTEYVGSEDVVEKWDKMRKEDGTYETIAILDASGVKTMEEAIMKFDVVGVTGGDESTKINSASFYHTYMRDVPEFMEKYCVGTGFIEYD